jgi:hypothetical protein
MRVPGDIMEQTAGLKRVLPASGEGVTPPLRDDLVAGTRSQKAKYHLHR